MPGTLVSDLITDFQAMRFSECGATQALTLLNRVLRYLGRSEGVRETTLDLNLIAGTGEYDLSATVLRVTTAVYYGSATSWSALQPTATAKETEQDPLWRQNTRQAEPDRFYITSAADSDSAEAKIGFLPLPPATTSTYPFVRLYVEAQMPLATDDRLPDTLHTDEVVLDWMAELYAKRWKKEEYEFWMNARLRSHSDYLKFSQNRTTERPKLVPGIFGKTTTI